MPHITYTYVDDDGFVNEGELPARMVVCPDCEGTGSVLREGLRGYAFSLEEFEDAFDEEQRAEYFRHGGRYDETCPSCRGANVVPVVDEDRLTAEQRTHFEAVLQRDRELAESDAIERAERRMGA